MLADCHPPTALRRLALGCKGDYVAQAVAAVIAKADADDLPEAWPIPS